MRTRSNGAARRRKEVLEAGARQRHMPPIRGLSAALSAHRPTRALLILTRTNLAGMTVLLASVLLVAVAVLLAATSVVSLYCGWFDR